MTLMRNIIRALTACFDHLVEAGSVAFGVMTATVNKTGRIHDVARLHELSGCKMPGQLMKALMLLLATAGTAQAITPPGTIISNTATASFGGGTPIVVNSNTVSTVSTIIATPSTVTLYQYDSTSSGALGTISVPVPTQHSTTPAPLTFTTSSDPSIPVAGGGSSVLDPNTALDLLPVSTYRTGEPVVVLVNDQDQNLNPAITEVIIVTVLGSTVDIEVIQLTETGNNTGEFIGYVQSTFAPVSTYDGAISLGQDTNLTVSYVDQYDGSDNSAVSTLVDPFGIVFDSATGLGVDGATIAIFDEFGNPASVFGDDGVSAYPNVLTTGGTATDASGTLYSFPTGGYRFPLLAPGNYRLEVTPPLNYQAPSSVAEPALQALPGAPYAINVDASYGAVFNLPAGPALRVDIPVDPLNTFLVLTKDASTTQAAVGDFVQYRLNLENRDTTATAASPVITDVLPLGFRYQAGSVRLGGVYDATVEPVISNDARTLSFTLPNVGPSSSAPELTYVTEITTGTRPGRAVNTATASDSSANPSNVATAAITISEDLFSSTGWILGRVHLGECDATTEEIGGLADVKLYLEDGTSVVTDEKGRFHFEGVRPGSHVVQLDTETLSEHYEVVQCEDNTRFAGTPYSQFVDLRGGSLWRTDFHVREKPPVTDQATISVSSELVEDDVKYHVRMSNGAIPVANYRLLISLPDGLVYEPGSTTLGNVTLDDPYINEQVLVYRLGDLGSNWEQSLNFRARLKVVGSKDMETTTVAMMDTADRKNLRSQPVRNEVIVNAGKIENQKIVYHALFKPMSVELTAESRRRLDEIIDGLGDVELALDKVIGYSDSIPIRNPRAAYKSNEALSRARAQSVADYLETRSDVDTSGVEVDGLGPLNPIASNNTAEGRARNRRVEIFVKSSRVIDEGGVEVIDSNASVGTVTISGRPDRADKFAVTAAPQQADLNIEMFDEFWLESAEPGLEWLMPAERFSVSIPAVNLAIKHAPGIDYSMQLNGERLNPLFHFGTIVSKDGKVARSYWQGVHLDKGVNTFEFRILDTDGEVTDVLEREVIYAGNPIQAEVVEEYSRLSADGTHRPVIAIRFMDAEGNHARPGTSIAYEVNDPYLPVEVSEALQHNRISGMDRKRPELEVGSYGIGLIELEPTAAAGRLLIDLKLEGESERIETWLSPEVRDWIMVGLMEGTVGYKSMSGNMQQFEADEHDDGFYADGRAAFFAKGRVKGEYLLTMSFDSDRGRFLSDNRVHQMIDPDTYYTIYGDASRQIHEASTSEKLYLKIEKEKFYAMFGDMDTDLSETELSQYNRRLTGIKAEAKIGGFKLKGFAAEDDSRFVKQEMQGDGTSGLYRLTASDLVINSERIRIETRDRFRSEIIIETRELTRHIDYSIDYQEGTLFFREPIPSRDTSFNPVIIVADYEVEAGVDGDISVGGRVSRQVIDDRAEVGVTVIHDATFANETDLIGIDAEIEIDDSTVLRAEFATTDGESTGAKVEGDAFLAEIEHDSGDLQGRAYVKKQESGFGLGQQSGTESGTTKVGVEGEYKLADKLSLDAQVYREENLTTTAERNVISANVNYNENRYTLSAGARIARDKDGAGNANDSDLLLLGASRKFFGSDLVLRANAEVAVNDDDNPDYPSRYILGGDYALTHRINLFAENEWTTGRDQDTQTNRIGMRAAPWSGASMSTTLNREVQENGIRSYSTLGLTQGFAIDDRWSADLAFDRSETIRDPGAAQFNTNVLPAQGTVSDDFNAISVGATYRGDTYTVANRVEQRNGDQEDKTGVIVRWERDIIDGIAYSLSTELFDVDRSNGSNAQDTDVRFSLGYRPDHAAWIVLNKLEYKQDREFGVSGIRTVQRKLIENFVANWKPDNDRQLSLNYGLKHVSDAFDGDEFSGFTQLMGAEFRKDLGRTTDYGLHFFNHYSFNSDVYQYSVGASFGWNLARNIWISFGYNFEGFEDNDFSSAGYTANGPYMKFRVKFDQDTAKEIQNWLN